MKWVTMDWKAAIGHVAICVIIGGVAAYFLPVKWLAASLWTSAALFINGSLAWYEDARPGGFDNPDGTDTPDFVSGLGAVKFWGGSVAIAVALAVAGVLIQLYGMNGRTHR